MTADQINAILAALTSKLSPLTEQGFALAVRWQVMSGIIEIAGSIPLLIGSIVTEGLMVRRYRRQRDDDDAGLMISAVTVVCAIAAVVALFFGIEGFMRLLNPEYSALRDLFSK